LGGVLLETDQGSFEVHRLHEILIDEVPCAIVRLYYQDQELELLSKPEDILFEIREETERKRKAKEQGLEYYYRPIPVKVKVRSGEKIIPKGVQVDGQQIKSAEDLKVVYRSVGFLKLHELKVNATFHEDDEQGPNIFHMFKVYKTIITQAQEFMRLVYGYNTTPNRRYFYPKANNYYPAVYWQGDLPQTGERG